MLAQPLTALNFFPSKILTRIPGAKYLRRMAMVLLGQNSRVCQIGPGIPPRQARSLARGALRIARK
jgi:hypothetical protein